MIATVEEETMEAQSIKSLRFVRSLTDDESGIDPSIDSDIIQVRQVLAETNLKSAAGFDTAVENFPDISTVTAKDLRSILSEYRPEDMLECDLTSAGYESDRNEVYDIVEVFFKHLYRIGSAIAVLVPQPEITLGSTQSIRAASIMWNIFLFFMEGSSLAQPLRAFALQQVKSVSKVLPRVETYQDVCNGSGAAQLREHIVELYQTMLKFGLLLIETVGSLYDGVSTIEPHIVSSETQGVLTNAIERVAYCSIAVDKDAVLAFLLVEDSQLQDDDIKEPGYTLNARIGFDMVNKTPKTFANQRGRGALYDAPSRLLTHRFVDRKDQFKAMVAALIRPFDGHTALCGIHGYRGYGKTQVALRYARAVTESMPAVSLFWLSAASTDQLHRGLYWILELVEDKARFSRDPNARLAGVRRCLKRLGIHGGRPWLLIVDDVRYEVVELLKRCLPLDAPWGQIVFTVRNEYLHNLAALMAPNPISWVEVAALSPEQALRIFRFANHGRYVRQSRGDLSSLKQIVKFLAYHPLAVSQVDSYLSNFADASPSHILDLYKEGQVYKSFDWNVPLEAARAVAATHHLTLLTLQRKAPQAYSLFCILAFFDPESISFGLFTESVAASLPESPSDVREVTIKALPRIFRRSSPEKPGKHAFRIQGESGMRFTPGTNTPESEIDAHYENGQVDEVGHAIRELSAMHLIGRRQNSDSPSIRIHEQIRDLVLEEIKQSDKEQFRFGQAVTALGNALRNIQAQNSLDKPTTWRSCSELAAHFASLTSNIAKLEDVRLARAYKDFAMYYYASGQFEKAATCLIYVLPRLNTREQVVVTESLAKVYMKMGLVKNAQERLESLFEVAPDDSVKLTVENLQLADSLATCYYLQGLFTQSEQLYRRILAIRDHQIQDAEHEKIDTYEGLANIYQRLGRTGEAQRLYDQVVLLRKKELGFKFISLQRAKYNQARSLRDQGKIGEAEILFFSVLAEYKDVLGEDHPETLLLAARLAFTQARQRKFDEAEDMALITLSMHERSDVRHELAICYLQWTLAFIYGHTGRTSEAEENFCKAIEGYTEHLGATHRYTACVLWDYSDVFHRSKEYDRAIAILEPVESDIEGTPAGAKLASLYDTKAENTKDTELRQHAQQLVCKTLKLQEAKEGKRTPDYNYSLWVLARIFRNSGKTDEARQLYERAHQGYTRIPGAMFGGPKDLIQEYGYLLVALGEHDECQRVMSVLIPDLQKNLTIQDPDPDPLFIGADGRIVTEESIGFSGAILDLSNFSRRVVSQ